LTLRRGDVDVDNLLVTVFGNTCWIGPWVHPLNEWALRQSRYDSATTVCIRVSR
jgi:hypothetical protein